MNQATFVWTLKSSITLKALGRTVDNLKLDKSLTLKGKFVALVNITFLLRVYSTGLIT